ncbi:MAG TPA: Gfo/Idh/MocA family oxidoreductase [Candidatus Hydrogenedentes bacterium]|nr:Gfo/Idh/MocA family oxidoreductase [Candidatus Hydrogenedentota bacterium]HPG66007.1 Gfo/Idh/MocA family oxidoreductase [Candidatus Hydrogenedentota bacterium]
MMRVGLVGYGYWGPNIARNFNANQHCKLVRIADTDPKRRDLAGRTFPAVDLVDDAARVTQAADIDIVAIATPVFAHHPLARTALENGKHVWLEKPMTSNCQQAKDLVDIAESKDLVLMVDHTFLFTGAVNKMKELVDGGDLGDLYYYDSVRINLGIFQHDVNVIWDLAPHDFSIMDYLLGPSARAISAHGADHFGTGLVDVAHVSVFYDNNVMAHFHVNWLSPVKIRRTIVGGSNRMLVWDDGNVEERIKVYDKGMEVKTQEGLYHVLATPRFGDMHAPVIPNTEALQAEVQYMVECITNKTRPFNDGQAGARIVTLLEACDRSLKDGGRVIEIG